MLKIITFVNDTCQISTIGAFSNDSNPLSMRYSAHKEEEKATNEQRAYNKLRQRKADKPYYQRYYAIYILVIIIGWVANLLSAVTESSKIYSFYYDFLSSLSFANSMSWVLVLATVGLIEVLHRLIASSYFKDLVENDLHTRDMTPKLVAMIAITLFSTSLSFSGGFDLIELVKEAPIPLATNVINPQELEAVYTPIIEDVKGDIQDFRKTREWKGRLSDDSAGKWETMKSTKQTIQLEQATAFKNLAQTNRLEQIRIDSLNQQRHQNHQAQVNERGYGLGFLSIAAVLVLYFCLWYDEEYQERKAIYLEKKYGKMSNLPPSPTTPLPKTPTVAPENGHSNGQKNGTMDTSKPIGFYTEAQKLQMATTYFVEGNSSGQTWTGVDREVSVQENDRHTVEHCYTKGGKTHIVHYTLRMVNSRIAQYHREVEDAKNRRLSKDVLQNRQKWVIYWQQKKQELQQKISE